MSVVLQSWYTTRKVMPGVWCIAEPQHCYNWLIEGDDRAILIDTSVGVRPLRPVVEQLTSRPITVVHSHCHVDHVGADHEFDAVEIHELGAATLEAGPRPDELAAYVTYARNQVAALETYRRLDREFFWLLTDPSVPRGGSSTPDDWESWSIPAVRPTRTFRDGDVIDLGGRQLTVIHTPGHSHDSICLFEERTGLLVAGDTVGYGAPLYAHWPDSDVNAFARSAKALAAMSSDVRVIVGSHYPHAIVDAELLGDLADALEDIQYHQAPLTPALDILGNPVYESHYPYFFITTPRESTSGE